MPVAFLAQSLYIGVAVAGAVLLVWKMKLADAAIQAALPVGAILTFLALATGAIWGKPTWGTYWVWDARLTSMLFLLFLYLGAMALRLALPNDVAGKVVALLLLVGVINIPIIKYSVEWWNTLHQGATLKLTEKPAMPPSMWIFFGYFDLWDLLSRGLCGAGAFKDFVADQRNPSLSGLAVMRRNIMAFESFSAFLQMGQHGVYVWTSFGLALVCLWVCP